MNLYYIKCLMFTKSKNIKVKREIEKKINLYSRCIDFRFKNFQTIDVKQCDLIV